MTRCTHLEARKPGHRYCPACHASYMREWRERARARRLHAVVERHVSNQRDQMKISDSQRCSKCGVGHSRNGQSYCAPCHAAYTREWRKTHPLSAEQQKKHAARAYARVYAQRDLLKSVRARVRIGKDWREGVYQFAVDYAESGLAEDPEQHKSANVIFLDEGQIIAVPNNRMQMLDTAFYEPFIERPDFRRNTHVFSSEGAA